MVLLLLLTWLQTALAVTPDQLEPQLLAAQPFRAQRKAKGAPVLSMAQMRRTAEGAIVTGLVEVPGSTTSKAYGAAVFDLPIAVMWSAINDETRHPGYTSTAYAELLSGRPCQSGRHVLQYIEVPWVTDRWWIGIPTANTDLNRQSGGSVRELTFRASVDPAEVKTASGQKILGLASPIASSQGGWFLVAIDERHTYIEYYVWTDPGGSIPGSLASTFATRGVRENLEAIHRFAKEGRPSCPIE